MAPQSETGRFIDQHRFVLLFGALVAFFVLAPIVNEARPLLHPAVLRVVDGILLLTLLVGVVISVSQSRAGKILAILLGLPVPALWLVDVLMDSREVAMIRHLVLVAFLAYVIWVLLRAIFASQQVSFNTVCASLCIYLLVGLAWALTYAVIDELDPTAFTCTVGARRSPSWLRIGHGNTEVVYFSFVTLTTLGYGDIVPTSPIGRMLASIEAITGQLYLAVLVARLVGLQIVYSTSRE